MSLLKKLISYMNSLFFGSSDMPHRDQIEPIFVEISPPKAEAEAEAEVDHLGDKAAAFFRHTQRRMRERYEISLTKEVWSGWNTQINEGNSIVLHVRSNEYGEIWRVWYLKRIVFVAFRDGIVVTVIPNNGQFNGEIKSALRKREIANTNKAKAVTTKTASLKRHKGPKLPPAHLRPKRNEAALALFRTNLNKGS